MKPTAAQCTQAERADRRTFQIRVAGLASEDSVRQALARAGVRSATLRTLLLARVEGRGALLELHQQLRHLGLDILEVRRVVGEPAALPTMAQGRLVRTGLDYELALTGEVDPALCAALQPFVLGMAELHTVLCASAPADVRFVDLVLRLEARGLRIASIEVVDGAGAPEVPRPRGAAERPDGIVAR